MLNVFEEPMDYVPNGDGTGRPLYNGGDRLRVQFVRTFVPDEAAMLETGKEVLQEQIIVLKNVQGDTNIVANRANAEDKRRYARQWKIFEQGESGELGHPLSQLYGMSGQALGHLAALGIHTVQQLVEAEESATVDVRDIDRVRALAKIWLEARGTEKEAVSALVVAESYKKRSSELEAENEKLKAELAAFKVKKKAPAKKPVAKKEAV